MAITYTPPVIGSGIPTAAVYNAAFGEIAVAFQKAFDVTSSGVHVIEGDIDMNGHDILNSPFEDGQDGNDGADGFDGEDGVTGDTGPTGPTGATGPQGQGGTPGTNGTNGGEIGRAHV